MRPVVPRVHSVRSDLLARWHPRRPPPGHSVRLVLWDLKSFRLHRRGRSGLQRQQGHSVLALQDPTVPTDRKDRHRYSMEKSSGGHWVTGK